MTDTHEKMKSLLNPVLAVCAAAVVMLHGVPAQADDVFEMVIHDSDIYGSRDVEAGDYALGIERLQTVYRDDRQPNKVRTPVLIDLCVAYTMTEQADKANEACNAATESGWYSGAAYNNRGAFHIANGDYEAAILDFQRAVKARDAHRIAERNLQLAQVRLRQQQNALQTAAYAVAINTNVTPK
jgi:Tfp pilus assembly protein PilF